MTNQVFIGDLNKNNYVDNIKKGLQFIKFDEIATKKDIVFIKPNLTFPSFKRGVMTNPEALEAAIISIKEYSQNIVIGDADSGGYNRFSMDKVYKETGIYSIAKKHGVSIINLSKVPRRSISFKYKKKKFNLDLPRILLEDIDVFVTMPVPKIHYNTYVSLTFKNQWGCIPEPKDRLRLHPYLEHVVLEVNKAINARVSIVDGKYGLNKNGPMSGRVENLNWILVSDNIGAAANVSLRLMQINKKKVKHINYIDSQGYIPGLDEININQDVQKFQNVEFFLRRKITDYPGYLAFQNPFIAYLAYFSPVSDFLHKLLYIFREPFYDYDAD